MNASRVVRLLLAIVCLATVCVALFCPLISMNTMGVPQHISISFLLGSASAISGPLGIFAHYLFFVFAVLWVITAILALIFPASKKAPGIVGIISGVITFIASSALLIILLATDTVITGRGLGGAASIGFGAIATPILCLTIIVLSIVVLALPDSKRVKQAPNGADDARFNEVPAPNSMPGRNYQPAQNYMPAPDYRPAQNYIPAPANNYGPATSMIQPAGGAHIMGLSGMYAGARFDVSDGRPVIFGRDTSVCSVIFDSSEPAISRQHCIVTYLPGVDMYSVRDISKNGTFIGSPSNRMPANVDQTVPKGTVLYLGSGSVAFRLDQ